MADIEDSWSGRLEESYDNFSDVKESSPDIDVESSINFRRKPSAKKPSPRKPRKRLTSNKRRKIAPEIVIKYEDDEDEGDYGMCNTGDSGTAAKDVSQQQIGFYGDEPSNHGNQADIGPPDGAESEPFDLVKAGLQTTIFIGPHIGKGRDVTSRDDVSDEVTRDISDVTKVISGEDGHDSPLTLDPSPPLTPNEPLVAVKEEFLSLGDAPTYGASMYGGPTEYGSLSHEAPPRLTPHDMEVVPTALITRKEAAMCVPHIKKELGQKPHSFYL